jgi:hypothetical protein
MRAARSTAALLVLSALGGCGRSCGSSPGSLITAETVASDAADAEVVEAEAPDANGVPLVVVLSGAGQVLTVGGTSVSTEKEVRAGLTSAAPGTLVVEAPPDMTSEKLLALLELAMQSGRGRGGIVLSATGKDPRKTAPFWLPQGMSTGMLFPNGTIVSDVRGHLEIRGDGSMKLDGSVIDASHPLDAALAARPLRNEAVEIGATASAPFAVVVDATVSIQKQGAFSILDVAVPVHAGHR